MSHVTVVLVRPRQPGNVGMAARAIANHGLGGLVLVDPRGYDPERARWMAPGAADVVDGVRITGTVAEAVAGAQVVVGTTGRRRRWEWPVWGPPELGDSVATQTPHALLFGPEDTGLSNPDLALCTAVLTLPTASHASLNLGQAVTVVAASLLQAAVARQAPGAPAADEPRADAAQRHAAVGALLGALDGSSWLASRSRDQIEGTLFRLLGRADPSERELGLLRGLLKAMTRRTADQADERT